jgi:hypothetical protein
MTGAERRAQARSIIALSIGIMGLQWLLIIAAPGYMGSQPAFPWLAPSVAIAMQAIGLAWMMRIYRASFDPEPDQHAWRYRG